MYSLAVQKSHVTGLVEQNRGQAGSVHDAEGEEEEFSRKRTWEGEGEGEGEGCLYSFHRHEENRHFCSARVSSASLSFWNISAPARLS